MMNKLQNLIDWFNDKEKVLVALSGGVDSALVAYAAYQKLDKFSMAVTADYKTLSQDELECAKKVCSEIGINHIIIEYSELESENFVKNDNKRCFYCRTELSTHIKQVAKQYYVNVIVDGTNFDDLKDYRPGIAAFRQNGIKSPLVETGFTKDDVRKYAKIAGLSIYDKPSNSCLASRIPWGQRVTQESLVRIELGENFVKQTAKVRQVRVRDLNGTAKIEVLPDELPLLQNEKILENIKTTLESYGFTSVTVDPEGYRPGKINVIAD